VRGAGYGEEKSECESESGKEEKSECECESGKDKFYYFWLKFTLTIPE
jgi:hypothetical protein